MTVSSFTHSCWQCFTQKITTSLTNKLMVLPTWCVFCPSAPFSTRGKAETLKWFMYKEPDSAERLGSKEIFQIFPRTRLSSLHLSKIKKARFLCFFPTKNPMPLAKGFFNSSVWVEKLFSKPFPGQGMLKEGRIVAKQLNRWSLQSFCLVSGPVSHFPVWNASK